MRIERLILREAIESTGKPLRTGGSTFYVRNGKLCVQSSTRPEHSGKNWKRTPARTKSNRRFAALRNVSTYLKEVYAGLPVWEVAKAKQSRTMTVENYLMSVMTPYFDEKGEVRDFEGIPLSEGGLVPPSGLRAEYAGGVVTLRWNVGEDEARVFKTLVVGGSPRNYYVFVLPVSAELDFLVLHLGDSEADDAETVLVMGLQGLDHLVVECGGCHRRLLSFEINMMRSLGIVRRRRHRRR